MGRGLNNLKLIVEQYLAFAETQASNHRLMYMKDWIEKLKLILTMNQFNILEHKGRISKELADKKVDEEYHIFKEEQRRLAQLESIKELDRDLKRLQSKKE